MIARGLVWLVVFGCSKRTNTMVDFDVSLQPVAEVDEAPPQVDVTARVREPGALLTYSGVEIPVLPGWTAQEGAPGSARLASMVHAETGLLMEYWRYPRSTAVEPRPQAGCEWSFVDGGAYRNIANLGAASVGTCVPDDASKPTRQVWIVLMGEYQWHVEARFPNWDAHQRPRPRRERVERHSLSRVGEAE